MPELKVQTFQSSSVDQNDKLELPANVVSSGTRIVPQPKISSNVNPAVNNDDILSRYEKSLGLMSASFKEERPDIVMKLEELIEKEKIKRSLHKGE